MKNIFSISFALITSTGLFAQVKPVMLINGTAHIGNGKIVERVAITIQNGKIKAIEDAQKATIDPSKVEVIDVVGQHIYPGFIAPDTRLGLEEIEAVRATRDYEEVGEINPNVRSIIAYNTDSRIIPTVRYNGVLLAQTTPQGGLVCGQSSVMTLSGWNWEDAALKADIAMHINWPSMFINTASYAPPASEQQEATEKNLAELKKYFDEAKAYAAMQSPRPKNLKFEAMRGVFNGSKKLFIHADFSKEIVAAVTFAKSYGITPVIVGADDATLLTAFLKENNVPVILSQPHSLPSRAEEDVKLPYKRATILNDAGILWALSINGSWQQRNLPFMAGTAAAYGMDKEVALSGITLNTAKILGIQKQCGSLEVGKDATLFVSAGDALDMRSNQIRYLFIRGEKIDAEATNPQKQLYEKFKAKYENEKKLN